MTVDADVLVVGCGPVGVMTALRCAQRGLTVIAIDRSREIYPLPRAIGMDDEIQDLFHRAGLGYALADHASALRGGDFVDASGARVVGAEMPEGFRGALGHPPMVMFDQPSLEAALRAGAAGAGVDIRLGVTAVGVEQDGDTITATTDTGRITAHWLVAADGAKSSTRDLLGIDMVDQGFDQTWLVLDATVLDSDLELPVVARQHCDASRITTFVPGHRNHRRWEFRLHDDETRDQMLEPAAMRALLAPWGDETQLRIDRSAVYRFHAVVASTLRSGRAFLAGDAAHQMPPFNGQGMCSGMRDAENLAWKLAHVTHGRAHPRLLDTYDAERRPHAAAQVAHSVDAGMLMDAIAHDGERALEAGYGRRRFPLLRGPLFLGEDDDGIGMPLPRLGPACDGTEVPVGHDWTVLVADGVAVPDAWRRRGAHIVVADRDTHPGLAHHEAVIVRPDRYTSTVTADLAASSSALAALLD